MRVYLSVLVLVTVVAPTLASRVDRATPAK